MTAAMISISPAHGPFRLALVAILSWILTACSPPEPQTQGGPAQMRRLTETQYRNSIADIFGADVTVAGRFEPIIRPDQRLIADGTTLAAVSPAGFEQYDQMARTIAAQVVDEAHRATLLTCAPASANAPDDDCAARFYGRIGRLLYRRPLAREEIGAQVEVARIATKRVEDFYAGLALGLAGMLVSPEFLFRIEAVEPAPGGDGRQRLDAFSKASRLSFFLWNTTPDEALLAAAERGDLHDDEGLSAQTERLLASPRIVAGVRAFFADMLVFEQFEELSKDALVYPKFNREIVQDSQEQMLRTITSVLIRQDADYRTLFTTRETFLTRALGMVYRVPVTAETGWQKYEFPQDSKRAGLITQIGFLSQHSHAGRSSATLRGTAVRELLLCQKIPDPPGNVDFSVAQDTSNPEFKTARGRLTAHRSNPSCAGCHRLMDPIGLTLENFDAIGEYRAEENDEAIDASGELDGVAYNDAVGLGQVIANNRATTECLARRVYEYASGRTPTSMEREFLAYLNERFAADGFRFRELLRRIAVSDALYRIALPDAEVTDSVVDSGPLKHATDEDSGSSS